MALELGRVYEIPTWERDDEWTYENGNRYKQVTYDVDFGTYVGKHRSYNLFITTVPDDYRLTYEMLYIEYDAQIEDTDFQHHIPMFDHLVRFVNSRVFPHPEISESQTTSVRFGPEDIDNYIRKHKYSLNKNLKNYIVKRRGTRKAGKKIANWMTALPPVYEIGFSGGPFYKRAAANFARTHTRKRNRE